MGAKQDRILINAATAAGTGASFEVGYSKTIAIAISINATVTSGTATVEHQYYNSATETWTTFDSWQINATDQTPDPILLDRNPFKLIRANITAYSSLQDVATDPVEITTYLTPSS